MNKQEYQLAVSDIKEEAIALDVGDNLLMYCPFCGATHEAKLSVTRKSDGLLYNCYRGTCSARGFIPSVAGAGPAAKKSKFKPRKLWMNTTALPPEVVMFLQDSYGFTEQEIETNGIKYAPEQERLVFPLYDVFGRPFGHSTKYIGENAAIKGTVKGLHYIEEEGTSLHYPVSPYSGKDKIVAVEDVLSSIKVARHCASVALLGTNISEEQARELADNYKEIILALDNDAISKAFMLRSKYSLIFRNFSVRLLVKDPKEMEDSAIKEEILQSILGEKQ